MELRWHLPKQGMPRSRGPLSVGEGAGRILVGVWASGRGWKRQAGPHVRTQRRGGTKAGQPAPPRQPACAASNRPHSEAPSTLTSTESPRHAREHSPSLRSTRPSAHRDTRHHGDTRKVHGVSGTRTEKGLLMVQRWPHLRPPAGTRTGPTRTDTRGSRHSSQTLAGAPMLRRTRAGRGSKTPTHKFPGTRDTQPPCYLGQGFTEGSWECFYASLRGK